jgi:hypothetical protein
MKYRKKPVVIEAIIWTGENIQEITDFLPVGKWDLWAGHILIPTLEGNIYGKKGDYIIKGVKGEFYPCKPDIFDMTYEPVEESI